MFAAGVTMVAVNAGTVKHSILWFVLGLLVQGLGGGCGVTTSLISLIANAGPADQAIATAGACLHSFSRRIPLTPSFPGSYLFRSLGQVTGLAIASTILQDVLRKTLHEKLHGQDVDEIVKRARGIVRYSYEHALNTAFWVMACSAGLALVTSVFIRETELGKK
ncbi:hypothetical protein BD626DRAFT_522405 [Schizophyllum amplum]|uniref:Major facilitator superfamily domain-containing protein n=1 Tax=Schizophyllum amplum TaxID=97359 RepID=A0A550BTA9_9AGAR|nr:hypothetical protein BD626DRAFT_522405 [Auriculariopsis ampla]